MCHWYSECIEQLKVLDDLTLLPELGRSKRDVMVSEIPNLQELAIADISRFMKGKDKTIFKGIGVGSLMKFHNRAKLSKQKDAVPYWTEAM